MKLSEIKLNPNNPRLIRDDRVKLLIKSIKDFPKMMALRPIIIDENNVILSGNMRYKCLVKLGYKEVPDEWVRKETNLTEKEKTEFMLKDNVSYGEFNEDILSSRYDEEFLRDCGLEIDMKNILDTDSKYDNSNCEYPLIPIYDEKYTAFIIICETSTEEAAIRTKFGFPEKARSYKKKFLGKSNVINAKDIL